MQYLECFGERMPFGKYTVKERMIARRIHEMQNRIYITNARIEILRKNGAAPEKIKEMKSKIYEASEEMIRCITQLKGKYGVKL